MGSFLPRSGFIFIQIGFWEGHGLSSQIKEPREKKKNCLYRSTRSRSVHHRVAELIYSHLLPLRYSRLTEYMLSLQFPSVDFTESTHSRLNFPQCQLGSLKWKFAEKILTLSALLSVRPSDQVEQPEHFIRITFYAPTASPWSSSSSSWQYS